MLQLPENPKYFPYHGIAHILPSVAEYNVKY